MDEELNDFKVEPFYGTNGEELKLTDLIGVELLQRIQDGFSDLTGCAALTTDIYGKPVTMGSNFTDFCTKYTRESPLGKKRCEQCDKNGAIITHTAGHPCSYDCHAGLIDFAAPIMADGQMVGSFIGGQVLTEPFDEDKISAIADELGIDRNEYIEAIKKVPVVSRETVEKASNFLYTVASSLSSIAFSAYKVHEANIQLEQAVRAKSDFLANMSHEIRTPMNAVLGMAEMALREEMSTDARNYIYQIKASGKNLLVIINDILDFSKIESGKMDIVPASYEIPSVVNDVANIVCSRMSDKPVEFIMDISPDIPSKLLGDNVRIQQIMINLLNNAVKFTKTGAVTLRLYTEPIDKQTVMLRGEVSDTGLGIKPEDLDKLFGSFQQVDAKRNRNIEGTGLGLAITSRLLELMGGGISVSSVYEKGTTFKFNIPQKVVHLTPIVIDKPEKQFTVDILVANKYVKEQLIRELERLDAKYYDIIDKEGYNVEMRSDRIDYLIVDRSFYTEQMNNFFNNTNEVKCVVIDKAGSSESVVNPNVRVVRKPVYFLNLFAAMGVIEEYVRPGEKDSMTLHFIAPDAHILIVDDNPVNLTVACGLLAPLKMQIDTADSCDATLRLAEKKIYDLVFMDHMMPEVDGIETAHRLRSQIPAYNDVPIIALTANALEGTREMFLKEGFNDFVTKPIDVKIITSKIHKWLPPEKSILVDKDESEENKEEEEELYIEGLDVKSAMALLGSKNLYMTVLRDYFLTIDKKASSIEESFRNERWREYTVEVHALKSTSRQVGADELSVLAFELELAGNNGNIKLIKEKTARLLEMYRGLKNHLAPLFPDIDPNKIKDPAEPTVVVKRLKELSEALDAFDTLALDEVVEKMGEYQYDEIWQGFFDRLCEAAESSDFDACAEVADEWHRDVVANFINR